MLDHVVGAGFDDPDAARGAVVIERPGGRPHLVLREEDRAVWIVTREGTPVGTVTAESSDAGWLAVEIESC